MEDMDSRSSMEIHEESIEVRSRERTQFIDLTAWVSECLSRFGVGRGIAQVQVMHTTAAIVVNENEPLLLEDFKAMLERLAPGNGCYAHDDFERRRVNIEPGERVNGHAHARALLLGHSKTLTVRQGRPDLGRWQSIFLVELDGPRARRISITVMGYGRNRA